MSDRAPVSTAELAEALAVELAVISQRYPWIFRELVNPKIGPRDHEKIGRARNALAEKLAAGFEQSKWSVKRPIKPFDNGSGY